MDFAQFQLRLKKSAYWLRRYMEKETPDYDAVLHQAYYTNAAKKLGIAYEDLDGVMEFNHAGVKRRILNCATDLDSIATTVVAGNKPLCMNMLKNAGLPVPKFFEVSRNRFDQALDKASMFEGKFVIKPANGTANAKGVTVGLKKDEKRAIEKAFWNAALFSESILLEEHVEGDSYRFLVCNGKLLSVSVRNKPFVIGDGFSSLEKLIEKENQRRMSRIVRLPELEHPLLFPIIPDFETPKAQGIKSKDVIPQGQKVICRDTVDMGVGSAAYDWTDVANPALVEIAMKTAEVTGVNLGGVDIICTDVTKPASETGACVNEINTTPGLRPHYEVENQEEARDVAQEILKEMFAM